MMKKLLALFLLITTSAFAAVIDADTKIEWNSIVVVAALHDAGLQDDYGTYSDLALTYNRILEDLLKRDTFSVMDAVSVCMQQCNQSTFLKDGRGQSGRKCPAICEDFGNALVVENNKGIVDCFGTSEDMNCSGSLLPETEQSQSKEQMYKDLYKSAQRCAEVLDGINISDVINAIKRNVSYGNILDDAYADVLGKIYDAWGFTSKFANYSSTSYELYDDLKYHYNRYCPDIDLFFLKSRGGVEIARRKPRWYLKVRTDKYTDAKSFVQVVSNTLDGVERFFKTQGQAFEKQPVYGSRFDYATKVVADALENYLDKPWFTEIERIRCSGKCRSNRSDYDYLTCALGSELKTTFKFAHICEMNPRDELILLQSGL